MKQPSGRFTSRRAFLSSGGLVTAMTLLPGKLVAALPAGGPEMPASTLAADPMRPQFHLLPARNWMNDPNGPVYFNGQYHMFFQYNPQGPTWGNMSWNHAVSNDMLHWSHLQLALTPTPDGPDSFGVFSGSALQVGKRVYFVYTGTKVSTAKLATIRDGQDRIQESQCLAWSDDPQLIKWTKNPQPVVPLPPEGMKITGFRDPSVWKQGDWYYMTIGAGVAKIGGCVLLYRSKDLNAWEYMHPLSSGLWNGKPASNPCDSGEMWECPEFFALDGGHVLIYSTEGKVFWQSGVLDQVTMKFQSFKTGLLDLDAFYAPKTQLDAHGRRILWGWIPERRPEAAMREAGWSGMMSLARVMNLDKDGSLRLRVLPESRHLRAGAVPKQQSATGARAVLKGASGEVICSGVKGKSFELTLASNSAELLHISYSSVEHRLNVAGHEVALEPTDEPRIHIFVDGSVIESIVSERVGYTSRFYYSAKTAPDITASVKGEGQITAWKISPITGNRLTTPASQV